LKTITQRKLPGWSVGDSTVAELIAIEAALSYQAERRPLPRTIIIATDSKRAIRYIVEGTNPHGQYWKEVRTSRPLGTQHIGVYTWQLDGALPGPHITAVYNALTAAEASILSQCRTGHSRLRSNLYRMKMSDTAGCGCGATRETITHVIYECPLL
jgi:hypothetical protein